MNRNNPLVTRLAIVLTATTTSALAAADDQRDSHHPDAKTSAASANKPGNAMFRAGAGGTPTGAGMMMMDRTQSVPVTK